MRTFSFKTLSESYRARHEPEKYIVAAKGIWTMILAATLVVIAMSVGYGIWQFVAPPDAVVTETAAGGITGFNRVQLSQIVEFYEKRQATFEGMMSGE